jgi:hypothetical protein
VPRDFGEARDRFALGVESGIEEGPLEALDERCASELVGRLALPGGGYARSM